jgi:hypothetical protein
MTGPVQKLMNRRQGRPLSTFVALTLTEAMLAYHV